jgi:geranylgeranyl pyrophosphate synthase
MELKKVYALAQDGLDGVDHEFRLLVDSQQDFPEMQRMLAQIMVGGKVVRPTLVFLCGSIFNGPRDRLHLMALAAEIMHIATLVHDDAIDSAHLRRGRPTINSLWGVDMAVLLGDFLFATAGGYAARTDNMRVVSLFTQTLGIIARGEIKQSFSSFKLPQTMEQYLDRIAGKTAALFAMSTRSGAILGHAPEESVVILGDYGYNLGLAFQVVDDVLDFVGNEHEVGKPVGADLAQGTLTLPSLKLLEQYPADNPVEKVFRHEDTEENIKRAIEMVRGSGIIDQCYHVAADFAKKACRRLPELPDKPAREALYALADYVIKRQK